MCCDYDDPPLVGTPHAPLWEARWGMTIEERLYRMDDEIDKELQWLLEEEA